MGNIKMNIETSTSDSESSTDWDVENVRFSLRKPNSRVSILRPHFRKSSKVFYRKMRNPTSTSHSESSSDGEDEADHHSQPETDFRYSSQESVELSNLDDSSSTSDELFRDDISYMAAKREGISRSATSSDEVDEQFYVAFSSQVQTFEECSSSTSDDYTSSDDESRSTGEFFDSSSCSIHNDADLDQSIRLKSTDHPCLSSSTHSNTSFQKSTRETIGLARSWERKSDDKDEFESCGRSDYFGPDDFTNFADFNSTNATTRNSNAYSRTAPNADSSNDPANFFPEEQCWMRLDILLRLKDMLHEIASDYKQHDTGIGTDIEQRILEIIKDNENQLKEQVPPELLEKIENQLTHSKLNEPKSRTSAGNEKLSIPTFAHSISNYDHEQASDSDSSDSSDDRPMDDSEEFKKYFDKHQTFISQFKSSGRMKPHSWRDDISSELRKNWAQSIAYAAETQVKPKPGKRIDQNGLKKFGECMEWEIFYSKANDAVEYSDMLCNLHNDIGHEQMSESEHEYLIFLAYKN